MAAAETEQVDLAKPGESIRCLLSDEQAKELAKKVFGLNVTKIKQFNGYDDRNFHLTVSEEYGNEFIEEVWPHGYVLKVINTLDSKKPEYLEAQSLIMLHLDSRMPGFCPLPVKTVDGKLQSLESMYQEDEERNRVTDEPTEHIVRLLKFKPGTIFHQVPQPDFDLFYEVGQFLGKVNHVFMDFSHSTLDDRLHLWSMYQISKLKGFTYAVRDPERRRLAEDVVETFCQRLPPNYEKLQKGTIHGDYNEQNVLVTPVETLDANKNPDTNTRYKQIGVIDFGDIANAIYLFEIGMTMMYLQTCSKDLDFLEAGGHVLAGYLSKMTLSDLELDLLSTVIAARYAQSLVLGEYYYMLDGNEYCLTTGAVGWPQLERFWAEPRERLREIWQGIIEERKKQEKA